VLRRLLLLLLLLLLLPNVLLPTVFLPCPFFAFLFLPHGFRFILSLSASSLLVCLVPVHQDALFLSLITYGCCLKYLPIPASFSSSLSFFSLSSLSLSCSLPFFQTFFSASEKTKEVHILFLPPTHQPPPSPPSLPPSLTHNY